MTGLRRLLTQAPNLLVAVLTTGLALAVLFGVEITQEQTAGLLLFLAAVIALVTFLVTPAGDVVSRVDSHGTVVAGAAAVQPTGTPIPLVAEDPLVGDGAIVGPVEVSPSKVDPPGEHRRVD